MGLTMVTMELTQSVGPWARSITPSRSIRSGWVYNGFVVRIELNVVDDVSNTPQATECISIPI